MKAEELNNRQILITGPNGFIGQHFIKAIKKELPSWRLKAISRSPVKGADEVLNYHDFRKGCYSPSFFMGITDFVHLAGLAHRFNQVNSHELDSINIDFLQTVLSEIKSHSIKKTVFLSSYSVSLLERGVTLDTLHYALSKQKAEKLLQMWFQQRDSCEVIILRPAMVYGKRAPGNFEKICKLLQLQIPLPLDNLEFRRSFLQVENLCSAILAILRTPREKGITKWDLADPWVETFSGFVRDLKCAVSGRAKLISVPLPLMRAGLTILGKRELFHKLTLSYEINTEPFIRRFNWEPPINFERRFWDLKK